MMNALLEMNQSIKSQQTTVTAGARCQLLYNKTAYIALRFDPGDSYRLAGAESVDTDTVQPESLTC